MTELLKRAIMEIEKLPTETQDALAARMLADLADEQAWAARVEATSEDQWSRLANRVREEIAAGDTVPLDDIFPGRGSED